MQKIHVISKNYEKKYYEHNFILVCPKKSISFILLARVVSRNFDRSRRSKIRRRQNDPKIPRTENGRKGNRLIARHTRGEQLIRLTRHTVNRIKACPGPSKLGRGDENRGKNLPRTGRVYTRFQLFYCEMIKSLADAQQPVVGLGGK